MRPTSIVEAYTRVPGDGCGEEFEIGAVTVKFDNGAGAVLTAQAARNLKDQLEAVLGRAEINAS